VLDRGRIMEVGSHDELLQRGGIYKRLYSMQFADASEL
jgi:subfamily B ATP-binding cassette protein MsbA